MTDVSVFHSLSYDRMYWAINLQRFSLIRRRHHRRFVISHHVRDPADSELSARFPAGPGVVIPNSHGEKLVGILHETGSKQLVIVCHGFQSTKDRIPMVNLAAALEREGISAFRFDFSGNGESEGSFLYGNYRREAEDLRAIVQDFCAKGRVITAIIGHSKGKLEYRVTQESLMDRLSTDIHAACHMICQDCRVLTIHGTKDKMVPAEDALEFDKFIPNHKLHIIEGADHEFTSHQDELASLVIQFIKANYQKDGPTSKRADGTIDSRM
ncbi:Hydrolase 4 domain-containing protein [Citrus sinensis]|uniref:Hydrolase 4 domain-containing protein n=1 Tax=Citrus sinensis TaxID=2711 RepID=A0ACB8NQC5_CITSI|nr:Hydrolase 4 domain-containing protein [Citrus sinensis]KAH9800048.1 Hydrolase 4 domain-containing protein [Citrus sinensis]